jgi:hypothetical protein
MEPTIADLLEHLRCVRDDARIVFHNAPPDEVRAAWERLVEARSGWKFGAGRGHEAREVFARMALAEIAAVWRVQVDLEFPLDVDLGALLRRAVEGLSPEARAIRAAKA